MKQWVEHKPMSGTNILKRTERQLRTVSIQDDLHHQKMKKTTKEVWKWFIPIVIWPFMKSWDSHWKFGQASRCSQICAVPAVWRSETKSCFDVEHIYGFVWWGVCKQSRWRHSVTEPSQDGGYVLLWQRYDKNKMVAMRYYGNVMTTTISQYSDDVSSVYTSSTAKGDWACYRCILHLQQYSHRLNLLYYFSFHHRAT